MLSFLKKRSFYFNKSLSEYCSGTTNESIRKLIEKYKLERNKQKIQNPLEYQDDPGKPYLNFYNLLLFLSISSITIYFYKKLK
jgi:hypothetical protein